MDFPTGGHHIAAADVVNRITAGGVINTDLNDMVASLLTRGDRARRGLRHDPLALHAGPQNGLICSTGAVRAQPANAPATAIAANHCTYFFMNTPCQITGNTMKWLTLKMNVSRHIVPDKYPVWISVLS